MVSSQWFQHRQGHAARSRGLSKSVGQIRSVDSSLALLCWLSRLAQNSNFQGVKTAVGCESKRSLLLFEMHKLQSFPSTLTMKRSRFGSNWNCKNVWLKFTFLQFSTKKSNDIFLTSNDISDRSVCDLPEMHAWKVVKNATAQWVWQRSGSQITAFVESLLRL